MSQRRGYLTGLAAYVIWGFFPLYFHRLLPASALEILAHRIVWSLVFVALLMSVARRWRRIAALARSPRTLGGISLAAMFVAVNWFVYIHGVNTGHVIETSLGYFINPLISMLFGVFVFRERLRSAQWSALGIGAVAVAVIAYDYGRLPWIALTLAVSFATYGLIKKRLGLPPTDGLILESSVLVTPALIYLFWLSSTGKSTFIAVSAWHTSLLVLAGALTAVPLLLFADAANRIPMTGLGIIQYAAPILQFVSGVFFLREPMPTSLLIGFCLVWLALAVFSFDAIRHAGKTRGAAVAGKTRGAALVGTPAHGPQEPAAEPGLGEPTLLAATDLG